MLGPLRVFGEYNRLNYWGAENSWRPRKQTRFGAEHWRSLHVNDLSSAWWAETWNGLWRQSANEFDPKYRSTIFANAIRTGVRVPNARVSAVTPYLAIESSVTGNKTYYWENRLLAGAGVRVAPSIKGRFQDVTRVNRFAVYAEYLHVAGVLQGLGTVFHSESRGPCWGHVQHGVVVLLTRGVRLVSERRDRKWRMQMKCTNKCFLPIFLFVIAISEVSGLNAQSPVDREVLSGTKLAEGFDMGVNTSGGRTDWLTQEVGAMKMAYPAQQSWGAVFVTVGKPNN